MSLERKIKFEDIVGQTCRELAASGSEIRKVFVMGQEYLRAHPDADIIDLSLGNPDLEPPAEIHEGLLNILKNPVSGMHRYMDNAGYADVREFVAQELSTEQKVKVTSESVYLTCGAAGALQILMRTLIEPQDEVIILVPYFSEYVPYSRNLGANVVFVPCDDFHQPRLDALKKCLNSKSRLLIVNSPNNPSGVVYSNELLSKISALVAEHNNNTLNKVLHVVSDEPYARLLFDGRQAPSFLNVFETGWLVRSHSKDLGLAGERIGFLAWGPELAQPEVLASLRSAARSLGFVNAPALMQRLLPSVYKCRVNVSEYQNRVEKFLEILQKGGISCVKPGGSFFVFPKSPLADDRAFCSRLVEKGVLCVPGASFGQAGFFRCSLSQPLPRLLEAAKRIISAV